MLFHRVLPEERTYFQQGIVAIEQTATYPLGDDFFQLDHGNDYFAFFDRLGDVSYYVALDGDRVAAVGAGVLRQVPDDRGAIPRSAWYLCDLKVHPDYQRQHLSLRLLRYALAQNIATCDRGYTISMNPGDSRANRLVQVLTRFPDVSFRHAATLGIYSLDAASMLQLEPVITQHRGPLSYFSLKGIKDLRLQSNGEVLPLLHVQWGATVQTSIPAPLPGNIHMFCAPLTDDLTVVLVRQEIYPVATASVLSHRMDANNWRFILTSDI